MAPQITAQSHRWHLKWDLQVISQSGESLAYETCPLYVFIQFMWHSSGSCAPLIHRSWVWLLWAIPELSASCSKHPINEHSHYRSVLFSFFFIFLTLQYCIGFAIYQNESATGIHVFPILNPPPSSLTIPSLWVVPVHQLQASSIMRQTWTGDSFHIWYYTCFNTILPNHPTLSLSHRVQKTVLYINVSFAVSYTGLLLPSLCLFWIKVRCPFFIQVIFFCRGCLFFAIEL